MVRSDEAMSPTEFERLLQQDIKADIQPLLDREILKKGQPVSRLLKGLEINRTEFSEVLRGQKLKSNIGSVSMTDAISALAWKDKPLPQRLASNARYHVNKWANDVTGGRLGTDATDDVSYYSKETSTERQKILAETEKLSGWRRFLRENKVVLLFFLLAIGLAAGILLLIKFLIELYI